MVWGKRLASNWLLYIGIFLVCTGFGTVIGILMLVLYFWDDLGKKLKFSQYNDNTQYNENTFNINNLNVNSDSGNDKDDFDTPMEHMSKDVREEMR